MAVEYTWLLGIKNHTVGWMWLVELLLIGQSWIIMVGDWCWLMLIHVDCWMPYIQWSSHILRTNSSDQCCMFYRGISPIWEARLACFGLGAEVQGQSNNAWLAIKIYLVHPKSASKFEFLFPKDTQSDSKYHSTLFCRFHCSAQELVVRHTFMYGFAGLSFKFSWMPNKVTLTTFQAKVTNKI